METIQNIPQLRFPGFDGQWENNNLSNWKLKVIDGDRGTNYPNGDDFSSEGYCLFMNAKNVTKNGFSFETKMFITKEKDEKLRKGKLKRNDLILTTRGSVGNIAFFDDSIKFENLRINSGMVIIRNENSKIDPCFIYSSFFTPKLNRIIDTISFGSAQPQLTVKEINLFKFHIPTLPEQQKIASFLSSVDEKTQQLSRKKELLEQYKKGVMQQLFSGKLRFKDENGKDYADWEEKKLGEVGETYNGLTGKTKENFGSGKPYIQYKQIFDNSKIDISRFELVNIGVNEKQNKVLFGDVFFTVSSETPNEIGTASVLLDNIDELYLNSFCFGYRANSLENLSPYFSRYLFRSELFRNEIIKLAQGSTRYNMSKNQLIKLKINLPCNEEQQKIANFLSGIDVKIESTNQQINQMQSFKKGLLQQMFV